MPCNTRFSVRKRLWSVSFVLTLLAVMVSAAPAWSQANVQGQWQTLPYTMPINPVHAALLPSGKVLIVSGSGNLPSNTVLHAALWDPQTGTVTPQPVTWDMFCNGMVNLPDGRPFIVGGTLKYDPFFGLPRTAIYDWTTNSFTDAESMAHGRWYPTATVLGDGRVLVFGGMSETGSTNTTTEIYSVGAGFGAAHAVPWTPPPYPRMHLLPNGNVFYSGPTTVSSIFNPTNSTWTTNVATTNYHGTRTYGSSVLLPLTPENGYKPRVMILGGGNPATNTTEIIDLSAATPLWMQGPNMSAMRIEMNATLLPNGKVLAIGGSTNDEDLTTAALNADLYDPTSNTFSSAGTEAFARLYHSVSLLMPDGRVWVAGGNPKRGTYEPHMEIYSPPYLFNADGSLATRPTITSVSAQAIGYGGSFTIQTPDAASILGGSVVLTKDGAVTHAFDMDQRAVELSFTVNSGALTVIEPPSGNVAPPGYYMLFLLNSAGVPSVASIVQVSGAPGDVPPKGSIQTPAGNVSVPVGQSVTYAGTGTDIDGFISSYFWNFEGGTPKTSNLANPGSVTYSTAGTYVTTLTVTDNHGVTDPHPPTRTITVTGPPDFSLAVSPSSQVVAQGGSTTYTTTVSAINGYNGSTTFSVSGLPTGASASFAPPSLIGPGSSTMTIRAGASTPPGSYALVVQGTSGGVSRSASATVIVTPSAGSPTVNFGSGFTKTGLQFNGHAALDGTRLLLTDTTPTNQVASVFWTAPVNVQSFTNFFTFQLTNAAADGFTFTIQNAGLTAIGSPGGGLGYGKFSLGTAAIAKSVAVKFDFFNNSGEGSNSTGLYTNGATPTIPATTLGGGVNLHSGDVFEVQMVYDGTTLTLTITDATAPADTFVTSFPIDIPATVGGPTALVGFTAGTGGQTAKQEILSWTYSAKATPDFFLTLSPVSRSVSQGKGSTYTATVTATNGFSGAVALSAMGLPAGVSATFVPATITGSGSSIVNVFTTPATVPGSYTITVSGVSGSLSHTATAGLSVAQAAGTGVTFLSGFTATGLQFDGHTKLNGTRLQLTDTTTTNETSSAFWAAPVNVQSFTNTFTVQLTNPNAD